MKSTIAVLSILVLALLLPACGSQEPDMAGFKKTVDQYNSVLSQGMTSGSNDAVLPYYMDDAMSFAPNKPALKGKDAIKADMDAMGKSGMKVTSAVFMTTELNAAGKMGYEVGTYDMAVDVPGMGTVKDVGKYIGIWEQQKDGAWKIHAEIWNSDMPPPMMNASKMDGKKSAKMDSKKMSKTSSKKATKAPAKKTSKPAAKKSAKPTTKKKTTKK